ncbi:MAG TPA: hypothetical protein VK209_05960, partial [Candidatus Sulfotelmatobacter sp.]|nr:hypothetical protein [Candidatus Sulfotelmatobacter sp.]
MNSKHRYLVSITLAMIMVFTFIEWKVNAQTGDFNLEAEQNWDTYGIGGTCVYGTQNIFVGDVDGDNAIELLTGGFAYYTTTNGSRTVAEAPLKVWSWNGQNVSLKASANWTGNIVCLYAADADGD